MMALIKNTALAEPTTGSSQLLVIPDPGYPAPLLTSVGTTSTWWWHT